MAQRINLHNDDPESFDKNGVGNAASGLLGKAR
jgi:hypothetical protein